MGVAYTLSRQFFWSENILWKEDLVERRATVFLSGKDSIINAPLVREYLQSGVAEEQQNGKFISSEIEASEAHPAAPAGNTASLSGLAHEGRLNVVWCADLDHGQIFDLAIWRRRLKNEILLQM